MMIVAFTEAAGAGGAMGSRGSRGHTALKTDEIEDAH